MEQHVQIESRCHTCGLRARSEANPKSLVGRFWRWHTNWCPGWKGYVRELESKGLKAPKV